MVASKTNFDLLLSLALDVEQVRVGWVEHESLCCLQVGVEQHEAVAVDGERVPKRTELQHQLNSWQVLTCAMISDVTFSRGISASSSFTVTSEPITPRMVWLDCARTE